MDTLNLRFVGPGGAPNTMWNLMSAPLIAHDNMGILFLPEAWQEEVRIIFDDRTEYFRFNNAYVASDLMRTRFLGWITSCMLRDKALMSQPVEERAEKLISRIEDLRDYVNQMSFPEMSEMLERIERGGARDLSDMLPKKVQ